MITKTQYQVCVPMADGHIFEHFSYDSISDARKEAVFVAETLKKRACVRKVLTIVTKEYEILEGFGNY